jgi:hypothetical protein
VTVRRQGEEHAHGPPGAGHVELTAHPVFRDDRSGVGALADLVLERADFLLPLRGRRVEEEVDGGNLLRFPVVPALPQVHYVIAHLGLPGGGRQLALAQPASLQHRVPRPADRFGRTRIGERRHREHPHAILRQPRHVRSEPRQTAAMRHDLFEAAVGRHPQPEPVAALGRLDIAVDEARRQVRRRPQVRHLAYRRTTHRAGVLVVSWRPRRQVKGHVLAEIGGGGQQSAHGPEHAVRQRRLFPVGAVRLEAVADGAARRGHVRELERGRVHVQFRQKLRLHVLLVRHAGRPGHDSPQQAKRVVGIFVARAGRRGKRDALGEPLVQHGVGGAQLLIAPGIVFGKSRAVAQQLPDGQRRRVAGGPLHPLELADPPRHRVFKR